MQNKISQCIQDDSQDSRQGLGLSVGQTGAPMMVDPHAGQQGTVMGRSPHGQVSEQ